MSVLIVLQCLLQPSVQGWMSVRWFKSEAQVSIHFLLLILYLVQSTMFFNLCLQMACFWRCIHAFIGLDSGGFHLPCLNRLINNLTLKVKHCCKRVKPLFTGLSETSQWFCKDIKWTVWLCTKSLLTWKPNSISSCHVRCQVSFLQ